MDLDLDSLTTVKKSSVQKQDFDMRYNHKSEKFQLSDSFYAKNNMNNNGMTLHFTKDGKTPVISIRPNEDSVFYKGKEGDADKDTSFAYGLLGTALKDVDLLEDAESGFEKFTLEPVGEKDGVSFMAIVPKEEAVPEADNSSEELASEAESDLSDENQDPVSDTEDLDEDGNTADNAVAEQEEDDDDPFAI